MIGKILLDSLRQTHRQDKLHPHWCVRAVLYLVVFLHTRMHVTFCACNLILKCITTIFTALLIINEDTPMPQTLSTVFARLGIVDQFNVYAVCCECHYLTPDLSCKFCPNCDIDMAQPPPLLDDDSEDEGGDNEVPLPAGTAAQSGSQWPSVPYMVAPVQLLSSSLRQLFQRPDMEAALNEWRSVPATPGELRSMWEADVWKKICGADGQSFFHGASAANEVGLGLHSAWTGDTLIMTRFRAENLLPAFMTPGPREPTGIQLQNYLRLSVDDLIDLHENGIIIKTREHPNGVFHIVAIG
ncbi:hypothetical protein C8F01DRAFT_1000106 [Mycena amicta]|nr:hypothetical protein C8F01DRAFT_1000106 [Mycena amicta]